MAGGLGSEFAFVYIPTGETVQINLGKLGSEQLQANWFNPRTGVTIAIGQIDNHATKSFDPPGAPSVGNDWVLYLYQKAMK